MTKILLGTTMLAGLLIAGAAQAADMPLKAPQQRVVDTYSWSGVYVGGHFGVGIAPKTWTDVLSDEQESTFNLSGSDKLGSHNAVGPLGGVTAGFNYQINRNLVIGFEGEFSFASLKGDHSQSTSDVYADNFCLKSFLGKCILSGSEFGVANQNDTFSTKVKDIATIAGRLGWAADRTLFYVKGGAAYVKDEHTVDSSFTSVECADFIIGSNCGTFSGRASLSGTKSRWGYVAGAGIEHALWGGWTAKVEYDYLNFGTKTVNLSGTACYNHGYESECGDVSRDFKVKQDIHTVKFGLNYRFWGGQY